MTEDDQNEARPDEDPVGTRYVLAADGKIIRDRRTSNGGRNLLLWTAMALLAIITVLSAIGYFQERRNNDTLAAQALVLGKQQAKQKRSAEVSLYEIRASQRNVCEESGNALREDVRDEFVSLKKKVLIPIFQSFIDLAPPGTVDPGLVILQDGVNLLHRRIRTIKNRIPDADCKSLYPYLDDPRTKVDEDGT